MKREIWIKILDRIYTIGLMCLLAYIFLSTFILAQRAEAHYTSFIGVVFLLPILVTIKKFLQESRSKSFSFWIQLSLLWLLLITFLGCDVYIWFESLRLTTAMGFINDLDLIVGLVFTAAILVVTAMFWGKLIAALIGLGLLYGFYGHLLPVFSHPYSPPHYIMSRIGMSMTDGYYWFARLAADKIFLLVVFAGLLFTLGGFKLFLEIGKGLARYTPGGAAFPSLTSSAAVGSVMGQAVSNIALTGSITIPMMKERGFRSEFAGAIETVISTSGQLLPPILGLGGFIMAGLLEIPYIKIALNSFIPGMLYVFVTVIGVLIAAAAYRIPSSIEQVNRDLIYYNLPIFVIPFIVILYTLLKFYTPMFAGAFGLISILGVAFIMSGIRRKVPPLRDIFDGLKRGTELALQLSVLLVAIGGFAQMILSTNLGSAIGFAFDAVGLMEKPQLLLVLVMIAMIIMGMGMPTPVAYTIGAITLAPALVLGGFDEIPAHFFVFYFAVFSTMTPPVAIGVLTAARIAGCSFGSCAKETLKLAPVLFTIPFVFVVHPSLLSFPNISYSILLPCLLIFVCAFAWASGTYGSIGKRRLKAIERVGFMGSSILGTIYLITSISITFFLFLGLLFMSSFLALRPFLPDLIWRNIKKDHY